MLSFSSLQDLVINIGLPSTAVIAVTVALATGYVPFDTEVKKVRLLASDNNITLEQQADAIKRIQEQHLTQMASHERALDALLGAMQEICFNTAKTELRLRACIDLHHSGHHTSSMLE